MTRYTPSRGFSTLEILLALMIMTTTLTTTVLVEFGSPNALANGSKELRATRTAAFLLTAAFQEGFSNFYNVTSLASTTVDGSTVSLGVTLLPDGLTKTLVSTADWSDIEGTERFVTLHSLITNYTNALLTSCSDVLTSDWTHPNKHTFSLASDGLLPKSMASHYPLSTFAVSSTTLVAGVSASIARTDPTIFIFDISSTTNPTYLGSIDNATSTKQGVNAIALSGSYVFSASAHEANFTSCKAGPACSQLQIFDISNPMAPVDLSDTELATATPPFASGSGGESIGKSIAYANGYVYLGLTKSGNSNGEEFNIIDVHDPRSPVWVGSFSIGRSINRIIIRGSYAYLATDDPTRELIVLNIQDPTAITLVGSYDAPGASTFGYGNDLALGSTTIALGRTYTPNGPGLVLTSIASTTLQQLSSESIASNLSPVNVQALLLRDFLLSVLTTTSLLFFDVRNPAAPISYANSIPLPTGSTGSALDCAGNILYMGSIGVDQTGYLTTITGS